MNFVYGFVAGVVVATIVCLLWPKRVAQTQTENFQSEDLAKKKENLAKIENYISDKERFTNDQLQNLLGVSDTTIGRYLEELEKQGKITQVGTGPDTYYTKS